MTDTQQTVRLIEQLAGGMEALDEILCVEVDRRLRHPEELTLAVAQCLEAQYAIEDLLPRLRSTRRTLKRVAHLMAAEQSAVLPFASATST